MTKPSIRTGALAAKRSAILGTSSVTRPTSLSSIPGSLAAIESTPASSVSGLIANNATSAPPRIPTGPAKPENKFPTIGILVNNGPANAVATPPITGASTPSEPARPFRSMLTLPSLKFSNALLSFSAIGANRSPIASAIGLITS